jgi:hypothetical protein
MSFLNRYVWQSRWVNTSDLSCIIFYWLEARSKSGKVLFASFFYINNKSFIYRKAQLNVVQQMYRSRILTKFYRRKNESDDQQLASVCYIILDTLMFFFFFVLTKKKKDENHVLWLWHTYHLAFLLFFSDRTKPV